ncbi:DUF3418 domain-containing protein, partial [Mycolicibacter minnesotensis]|uniref:DUF3418 domain-containing protein n=1 Tax=Mycolicibacter minnesotensis TaxID=1118379 RepID=UPI003908AC91
RWIVVADLVETSRLYGRIAARIQPDTVERIAGDLVARTRQIGGGRPADGQLSTTGRARRARGRTPRQVVRAGRARDHRQRAELFIRHALVEGDWQTRHHFFRDNAALREQLTELEEKA